MTSLLSFGLAASLYMPKQFCSRDRAVYCCHDDPIKVELIDNKIGWSVKVTYLASNRAVLVPRMCRMDWDKAAALRRKAMRTDTGLERETRRFPGGPAHD